MNWDAVGAVAEIAGSLAVVVTLAYLLIQMKLSHKSAKGASTNQTRAALTDVLSAVSENSETVMVYARGLADSSNLESHERVRFDLIIYQMMRVLETCFLEYHEGLVSEELWQAQWRGSKSVFTTRGGRQSWTRQKYFVSQSFMTWVSEHLDD